jgi:hypothetical protein
LTALRKAFSASAASTGSASASKNKQRIIIRAAAVIAFTGLTYGHSNVYLHRRYTTMAQADASLAAQSKTDPTIRGNARRIRVCNKSLPPLGNSLYGLDKNGKKA